MSEIKAFNELIANSIDSWIEKATTKKDRGQLVIEIFFTDEQIVISDNASGMKKQDMLDAMGFGMAQKHSKKQLDRGPGDPGLKFRKTQESPNGVCQPHSFLIRSR